MRRAADILHISQPALTRKIQAFERVLGIDLFDRESGKFALTPAGTAMIEEAEKILAAAEEARQRVAAVGYGPQGVIRLSYVEPTAIDLLPRILPRFSQEFPNLDIALREMGSLEAARSLELREIDFALLRPPINASGIEVAVLRQDPLVAALPIDHPIDGDPVEVSQFRDEPFVCYSDAVGSGIHHATLMACATAGYIPQIARLASSTPLLMSLVAEGHGVAFVSHQFATLNQYGVKFRSTRGKSAHTYIALARRAGHQTTLFNAMKRIVAQVVEELDREKAA